MWCGMTLTYYTRAEVFRRSGAGKAEITYAELFSSNLALWDLLSQIALASWPQKIGQYIFLQPWHLCHWIQCSAAGTRTQSAKRRKNEVGAALDRLLQTEKSEEVRSSGRVFDMFRWSKQVFWKVLREYRAAHQKLSHCMCFDCLAWHYGNHALHLKATGL